MFTLNLIQSLIHSQTPNHVASLLRIGRYLKSKHRDSGGAFPQESVSHQTCWGLPLTHQLSKAQPRGIWETLAGQCSPLMVLRINCDDGNTDLGT